MSKDFPTLEENIRIIVNDLGAERILGAMQPREIAQSIDAKQWTQIAQVIGVKQLAQVTQAIPDEQKETLLRILIEQLGTEKVEAITRNN